MSRIDRRFQLANDGDVPGVKCTSEGLSLAGAPLLRKTAAGFAPRPADEIGAEGAADAAKPSRSAATARPSRQESRATHPGTGVAPCEPAHRSVDTLPKVAIPKSPLSLARQEAVSIAATIALEADPAEQLAWRTLEAAFGMGDNANPGPGRLIYEWRTGTGPQTRVLAPTSAFSQQFAVAPSTEEVVQRALKYWNGRAGGLAGKDGGYSVSDLGSTFGPKEFAQDTRSPNPAAHVIGSFNLAGIVDGDTIH